MPTTTKLNVAGMKCGGCESNLKAALSSQPGVIAVRPSHKEAMVEIEFDDGADQDLAGIKKIIVEQGFTVSD